MFDLLMALIKKNEISFVNFVDVPNDHPYLPALVGRRKLLGVLPV